MRLCAIDVDRGAAGDRVRVTNLGGHAVGAVVRSVLPHPSLPLVATLDSSGRAVVWGCALQGQPTTDAADATEADATGAATLRYLAALSTPATAAAWLPGATSTQLLVASAASAAIEAHGRTAGGAWATHAAPLPPPPVADGRWDDVGVFDGGDGAATHGFAFGARGGLAVWRARPDAGGAALDWVGSTAALVAAGAAAVCGVSALAQRGWLGGGATDEVGALVACSADGSAALWSVRLGGRDGIEAVRCGGVRPPPPRGVGCGGVGCVRCADGGAAPLVAMLGPPTPPPPTATPRLDARGTRG